MGGKVLGDLWKIEHDYIRFDNACYHIGETCGGYREFIPYERNYGKLDKEQILQIIKDAKKYQWQALDLSNCGLKELPDELWELSELKLLYLGENLRDVFKIDEEINEGESNKVIIIPRKIEKLKKLQVLSLAGTKFQVEGEDVLKLPQLRHLDIFDCQLRQIPTPLLIPSIEEIGFNCLERRIAFNFSSLKNLRRIYLSNSKIVELPDFLGTFYQLEELYLCGTKISSLPKSLEKLRFLEELSLEGTPLAEKLPPEILRQSAKEIVKYVLAQQSDVAKEYFNESKMVIVGQGHVGKSSILNRLINNTYEDNKSTEGIDISEYFFTRDDENYKLNVWDFGGQEIYHSTHQFFLTKRSLYLLVWDALAEEEYGRIDYWLKTIQSLAGDSPIIIVVNKCDQEIGRIRRIDAADYIERFPQIKDVLYVSCKDNIGISELRKKIETLAVELPLMKTSWLSSWLGVRDELENLSESFNYILYNKYLKICKTKGIDEKEALSLIKYLHDLGIVFYYHDDSLLKNIVILSTEWGTDAVYKVLDEQEKQLKGRNGLLYMDDLPKIWESEEHYPPDRYPYLLNLMKKFQLAFEIDESSYLVAELLDNIVIVQDKEFPYGETISFRYEYDFVPAGIMTRFIVASNRYIEMNDGIKQCWKKGAYLIHHTAYALVRLYDNLSDHYVEIKVSGTNPRERQELLTIIRSTFEGINSQFSQIKITEKIPCICSEECNFLFDYRKLLFAEQKGKRTIECHDTFEDIDIRKILDGVETYMENKFTQPNYTTVISPQINPQINQQYNPINTNTTSSNATSTNVNTLTITAEIRDLINGLYGDISDLKEEVGDNSAVFNEQCEKIDKALEKLDSSSTKEDIIKSGALKKIERFLKECHDSDSEIGKLLSGVKFTAGIIKDLAGKYNKIAKWVALPQLPFGDS